MKGHAPYKEVITHGFVLDENGAPYSKSAIEKARREGKKISYIDPDAVMAKYGAEIFRLWTASIEFRADISYSQKILDGLAEWYRKFRNTARFLLGTLRDFQPDRHGRDSITLGTDRYMLARLDDVIARAHKAYEAFELHTVHRLLVEFVTVDVSAFYSDVAKDRLYSDGVDSPSRRAAQVVLYECLRALATLSAPIMAFTAEDIWQHMPRRAGDPDSVHLATYPEVRPTGDADAALVADFAVLIAWRERVTKELEPFRAAKHKSVDARVTLHPSAKDRAVLERYAGELADLFIVSAVEIGDSGDTVDVVAHTGPRCERCWKHFERLAAEPDDVCERCAAALTGAR